MRAGVLDLVILDHEALVAQNLVRHTLTVGAIGANKALALATRLRFATPNARVSGIASSTDSLTSESLGGFDLVVETTGDHRVLEALERLATSTPVAWASISISARARRLFAFFARGTSMPVATFDEAYEPFARAERERGVELPMEGVGCWHPVFPARADEVWILAAAAVGLLETHGRSPPGTPGCTSSSASPETTAPSPASARSPPTAVYVSVDEMVAVVLDDRLCHKMVEHCRRAGRRETGGILIGRYYSDLHDQALVTVVTGPPPGLPRGAAVVRAGRSWARSVLARAWRSNDTTWASGTTTRSRTRRPARPTASSPSRSPGIPPTRVRSRFC